MKKNIKCDSCHLRRSIYKFGLLCILVVSYFGYLTYQYDILTGGMASILTWSFFVLCTPVADAGFLLDFPLRLLFGIRMLISEIAVWIVAIILNLISLFYYPEFYETTLLTKLLYQILITPYPYWLIIFLSFLGTFLSIQFGDKVFDAVKDKNHSSLVAHHFRYELVLVAFFIIIVFAYYQLIHSLGISGQF